MHVCVCLCVCAELLFPVQVPLNEYDFAGQKLCNVQLQVGQCVCVCVCLSVCLFACVFVHDFGLWKRELLSGCGCYRVYAVGIGIGNRMDESAIWEKIAWQQEYCTRQSRVLFEPL